MKQYKNGSLLLEDDKDKKIYSDAVIAVHELITIAEEYPEAWEFFKEVNADALNKLYNQLNKKVYD